MVKSAVMAEHILRIPLAELKTVRVICDCGLVTETTFDKLGMLDGRECPGCRMKFTAVAAEQRHGPLFVMCRTIEEVTKTARFKIEFAVPPPAPPGLPL